MAGERKQHVFLTQGTIPHFMTGAVPVSEARPERPPGSLTVAPNRRRDDAAVRGTGLGAPGAKKPLGRAPVSGDEDRGKNVPPKG